MAPAFRIAVIIPARTCPYHQVVSVLEQLTPDDRLVVVLNGLAEADRFTSRGIRHPLLRWVNSGSPIGAGCARNLGAKTLEEAPMALLFCDVDDHVAPTWLAELARPLLADSADLVGGALRVRRSCGPPKVVIPTFDYWYRQAVFGGNMGITYEAWCRLGGFDDSFICCEDTELAWRAGDLGLNIQVVPSAIADVNLRSPLKEFRQRYRWGRSSVQLLQTHGIGLDHLPGLRTLFLDKRTTGFAKNPAIAALGQWVGQCQAIMSRL